MTALTFEDDVPDVSREEKKEKILALLLPCCPLLAPQITGILCPVASPVIVNSSWQAKPVSSTVEAPARRLNDSKSSRRLHTSIIIIR